MIVPEERLADEQADSSLYTKHFLLRSLRRWYHYPKLSCLRAAIYHTYIAYG
jgi:hypothetical protein